MDLTKLLESAVGTLIRHGGNALGTILVSRGLIDTAAANSLTELLVGLGVIGAMIVLSLISKKKALETPTN